MQITSTRKVVVLVLTALMIAATVFAFASAITATDAEAGVRVGTSPGTRESTERLQHRRAVDTWPLYDGK